MFNLLSLVFKSQFTFQDSSSVSLHIAYVLGKLDHSLFPGASVLPMLHAPAGPFTWDVFSLPLEVLPTLQGLDQMLPFLHTASPDHLLGNPFDLWLHLAPSYWNSSLCVNDLCLPFWMAYSLTKGGRWGDCLIPVVFPIVPVFTSLY